MELIGLIIKFKAYLIASLGVLGIMFALVLAPFVLPFFVFGGLALVFYALYEGAKRDVRRARNKVQKSSRKLHEAKEQLAGARDEAILRAQRAFENAENSVEDFAIELDNARRKAISDAQSQFEKSEASLSVATELVKNAEKGLAQLQVTRAMHVESGTAGKFGVAVLLKHARNPKRKLEDSWHEVKTKLAESKLTSARDDLHEAFEDVEAAADELELAKAHQSEATKRHEERLEISKNDLDEVARMLDEAKTHRSERTKKQEGKLLNAEQKHAQEVEKLQKAESDRDGKFGCFLFSLIGAIGIPVGLGFWLANSG